MRLELHVLVERLAWIRPVRVHFWLPLGRRLLWLLAGWPLRMGAALSDRPGLLKRTANRLLVPGGIMILDDAPMRSLRAAISWVETNLPFERVSIDLPFHSIDVGAGGVARRGRRRRPRAP